MWHTKPRFPSPHIHAEKSGHGQRREQGIAWIGKKSHAHTPTPSYSLLQISLLLLYSLRRFDHRAVWPKPPILDAFLINPNLLIPLVLLLHIRLQIMPIAHLHPRQLNDQIRPRPLVVTRSRREAVHVPVFHRVLMLLMHHSRRRGSEVAEREIPALGKGWVREGIEQGQVARAVEAERRVQSGLHAVEGVARLVQEVEPRPRVVRARARGAVLHVLGPGVSSLVGVFIVVQRCGQRRPLLLLLLFHVRAIAAISSLNGRIIAGSRSRVLIVASCGSARLRVLDGRQEDQPPRNRNPAVGRAVEKRLAVDECFC